MYIVDVSFTEVPPKLPIVRKTVCVLLRQDVHILRPIDSASRRSGGIFFVPAPWFPFRLSIRS
jgi:hypothetical protein